MGERVIFYGATWGVWNSYIYFLWWHGWRKLYSHLQQHPLLLYGDAHLHGCTYDMHLGHLKTHGFSCSTLGSFDIGGTSSNTKVNRIMIGDHFCYHPHTLLYIYDWIIHGFMGKNSLSHLKSPCFCCSLFGSYLSGDSSFNYWMK